MEHFSLSGAIGKAKIQVYGFRILKEYAWEIVDEVGRRGQRERDTRKM